MSKYPVKRSQRTLREVNSEVVEVIPRADSYFTFRYSHTEISAVGGKAYVKSRQTRLEDGKLTTDSFEGDVDRSVYDRLVDDTQRYFLSQTSLFAKSLSWWLPSSLKVRSDQD